MWLRRQVRPTCRHCGSEQLTLQPGRFSLHFTCAACNRHTPIEIGCGEPRHGERIRQDGRTFYRECPQCRTRTVFFVNPGVTVGSAIPPSLEGPREHSGTDRCR